MTNEEILNQQVEALERLLQLKQAIIDERDKKINSLEMSRSNSVPFFGGGSPITIQSTPYDYCPVGPNYAHNYPTTWSGTMPPSCTKCGKQQQLIYGGNPCTTAVTYTAVSGTGTYTLAGATDITTAGGTAATNTLANITYPVLTAAVKR